MFQNSFAATLVISITISFFSQSKNMCIQHQVGLSVMRPCVSPTTTWKYENYSLHWGNDVSMCLGIIYKNKDMTIGILPCTTKDEGQQWSLSPFGQHTLMNHALLQCLSDNETSMTLKPCQEPTPWEQSWSLNSNGQLQHPVNLTLCVDIVNLTKVSFGIATEMDFDGSSPGFHLGPMTLGEDITFSVWVWDNDIEKKWARVLDLGNGAPNNNILLAHSSTSGRMIYQVYHGTSQTEDNPAIVSQNKIPQGQWVHVVIVQKSNSAFMYWNTGKNWELVAHDIVKPPISILRNSNFVGQSNWRQDALFSGKIHDLAIWSRALSEYEWQQTGIFLADTLPLSSMVNLCSPTPPPMPPITADELIINTASIQEVIDPKLFGLNLEFTRHDIWEGISSQLIANRMFALQPKGTKWPFPAGGWNHSFPPRWHPIGNPIVDQTTGAILCNLQSKQQCGVKQNQVADGFDSGMSFGSAIVLYAGNDYTFRIVVKSDSIIQLKVSLAKDIMHTFSVSHNAWVTLTYNFTATKTTMNATLEITADGTSGKFWLAATSLMQSDNFLGMRRDVINNLKEINFNGLFRFPGGCFAPFYNWKDGLLEQDRRPVIYTPPNYCAAVSGGVNAYSDGFLENGVGIDEYIALCKEIGATPAITIALQFGTSEEIQDAADWVEYCNGDSKTKWGQIRASRGHPLPYNVKYWYLGNEINLQRRYPDYPNNITGIKAASGPEYASMLPRLISSMKKIDSSIKLFAVEGGSSFDIDWISAVGKDIIATSFHGGYANIPGGVPLTPQEYTKDAKIPSENLAGRLDDLRILLNKTASSPIGISADEWGLGYPWIVRQFNVAHAMYGASFLSTIIKIAAIKGVYFTNYFEPINEGAISVLPFKSSLTSLGMTMSLFSKYQGCQRLLITVTNKTNDDIEVVAALTPKLRDQSLQKQQGILLTLSNRNSLQPYIQPVHLEGGKFGHQVQATVFQAEGLQPSSQFVSKNQTFSISEDGHISFLVPAYSILQAMLPFE